MAVSNNEDAFQIQRDMLQIAGLWPIKKPSIYYNLKAAFSWIMQIVLCITMWMQVIKVINDFTRLSEILYIMVTITAALIKLGSFTYHKKYFFELLQLLQEPVFISYPDKCDKYMATTIKYSRLIANTYRYLVFFCVFLIGLFPIVDKKSLPFPFDFNISGYIIPMYAFQLTAEFVAAWCNSSLDTLCTSLMGIAAAQLDILSQKIIHIKNKAMVEHTTESEEIATRKLKQCVEHYSAIIKLTELIEKVFTLGLFAQFLTSIIVLCNTVFHFVLISVSFQFFMLTDYLVILMIQLFMYCWYGNEIIVKSLLIGEACYQFHWYNFGHILGKYIFIIMERSKKPLYITTLNFSTLSLRSFTAILQWSYSCLALLLKMYYKTKPIDISQ